MLDLKRTLTYSASQEEALVTISHVHCRVKDLIGAVDWLTSRCGVLPSFSDAGMAVLLFGAFTLILDAAFEATTSNSANKTPMTAIRQTVRM